MGKRSYQSPVSESSDRIVAAVPSRPWSDPQFDQAPTTGQDFSGSDLFSHDPGVRSHPATVQAKLAVGKPGDHYEQEADRVADQVMGMPQPTLVQRQTGQEEELQTKPLAAAITPIVQRQDAMPEEEELAQGKFIQRQDAMPEEEELAQGKFIQRQDTMPEEEELAQGKFIQRQDTMPEEEELAQGKFIQRSPSAPTATLETQLNSSKGSGSPLPSNVRAFMEPRFGADFSQVRVHTGGEAVQMNQGLQAQAFTHGTDIYYGEGKSPGTDALTAHELTHVVQQTGAVQMKEAPDAGENSAPGPSGNASQEQAQALQQDAQTTTGARVQISPELLSLTQRGSRATPELPSGHEERYSYQEHQGEPFVQGPGDAQDVDPNDVQQGQLGDCYLLAALAAIARVNPDLIRNMIQDNGDGTYDVTLYVYEHFWSSSRSPKVVTVTNTFPSDESGNPAYAQQGDQGPGGPELWVMLIEKAYAMTEGGYADIEGGFGGDAMELLTNRESTSYSTDDYPADIIATTIHTLLSEGWAITAGSRHETNFLFWDDIDGNKAEADRAGVVTGHEYTVISVDVSAGTIDLQNPWGQRHVSGMPISTFKRVFSRFDAIPTR